MAKLAEIKRYNSIKLVMMEMLPMEMAVLPTVLLKMILFAQEFLRFAQRLYVVTLKLQVESNVMTVIKKMVMDARLCV
jgi:hypothetical protein